MNVAEYLVDFFIRNGVTDVFGIPGGVVLDLLYAFDKRNEITAHLSYHEQAAAFEACGYAQVDYKLGVAYATRGPGFTNLLTGIADAYADSIPVMFITAHLGKAVGHTRRFEQEQEMDTVQMVKYITKYAVVVEELYEVEEKIHEAYRQAMTGRKGPVLLDFSTCLWNQEIIGKEKIYIGSHISCDYEPMIRMTAELLERAKRPIFLLGDGIRQAGITENFSKMVDNFGIPVLTSRCSQDVGSACVNYYGYIGSHGIRYSNFIFAKADLVIALGNRLSFPAKSKSFLKALENKKIIRFEIDQSELERVIPNTNTFHIQLEEIIQVLERLKKNKLYDRWLEICAQLKRTLKNIDINSIVISIAELIEIIPGQYTFVSDVGNNEFWVSRAYEASEGKNRILYSKSFGALGGAIGKAIGVCHKTGKPVVCITGDQGVQLNIQEFQLIAQEKLPIAVVIINNHASGMIKDREYQKYGQHFIHTTIDSGFGSPRFDLLAKGYNIEYCMLNIEELVKKNIMEPLTRPIIIEGIFSEDISLMPDLPKGNLIQDMTPELDLEVFKKLEKL